MLEPLNVENPIQAQRSLLIDEDRHCKQLAISAAIALIIAIGMITGQGHVGVTAGISLGSSALLGGGALLHYKMRQNDLKNFELRDQEEYRWSPTIRELLLGKAAVRPSLDIHESL